MSTKGSKTTTDYIPWNEAMQLIKSLYNDENYRMSLFVSLGCFWGLRVSDILELKWSTILDAKSFTVREIKTGKSRSISVNEQLRRHIRKCYEQMRPKSIDSPVITNRLGEKITTRYLNQELKRIKMKYNLHVGNISTHSLRKTFGRQVYNLGGKNAELSLMKLCEIFNHTSVAVTRRYLGLRAEELAETYESLSF